MVFYLYALSAVHCITATGNVYPDREAVVCINNANLSLLGLYGKDRDTCWCTTPPGLGMCITLVEIWIVLRIIMLRCRVQKLGCRPVVIKIATDHLNRA